MRRFGDVADIRNDLSVTRTGGCAVPRVDHYPRVGSQRALGINADNAPLVHAARPEHSPWCDAHPPDLDALRLEDARV